MARSQTPPPAARTRSRSVVAVGLGAAVVVSLTGCGADRTAPTVPSSFASTSSSTSPRPEPSATATATATVTNVVALIAERLDTAPDVAAAKHHSGQPVEDAARERTVLDAARTAAERDHVDPDWVEAVFSDQIEASKQAQTALLDEWSRHPDRAPAEAPDLTTSVRPTLDRITTELVSGLARLQDLRGDPTCDRQVRSAATAVDRSTEPVRDALPTALAHLCTRDAAR